MSQPSADPVDLAIIGAGPTGLFAAFYAGLRQMSVKLVISLEILGGLANVTIPFNMGPISPYVTAGLAGFNIKTKLGDAFPGAEDESDTKFAVNGGAGLSMRLMGVSAFIEAKINNVYTDKRLISNKELKDLQFIPVTFGFVF
jgi:hypothetical protein